MSAAEALLVVLLLGVALAALGLALRRRAELDRPARFGDGDSSSAEPLAPADGAALAEIADALEVGLVRVGAEGRIDFANAAAHRFLGRRPGTLTGKSTMEAFVDHRIEELTQSARAGNGGELEVASTREPPTTMRIRARRAGRDGPVWVVLDDVSELRRLQRIRSEFIDNLSHELRTPVATLHLLSEMLALELERTELPPRASDAIRQIEVETGQLAQMVSELLDLSRIEYGEVPLRLDEVDLGRLIERALERLRPYAERQGVRLASELPSEPRERRFHADEHRLEQLVLNLVHNAVKFSPGGGDVTVRLRPEEESVFLVVEDEGVGIPREELGRIFERFYKVDRARSRGTGGTGLGLAITRHIVERHGGRIWAERREGKGSRFFVALPRTAGEDARRQSSDASAS